MRRILFVCVAIAGSLLFSNTSHAQVKLGYFDETKLLPLMPGIKKIDTVLAYLERDTLDVQYDTTYRAYKDNDSLYHRDSASLSPAERIQRETVLTRYKARILYWNDYAQRTLRMKEAELQYPFKRILADALMEIVNEQGYTLVVNTGMLSKFATPPLLDNLTIRVAMKLNIPLSKSVQEDWKKALAKEAAKTATKAPVKAKK